MYVCVGMCCYSIRDSIHSKSKLLCTLDGIMATIFHIQKVCKFELCVHSVELGHFCIPDTAWPGLAAASTCVVGCSIIYHCDYAIVVVYILEHTLHVVAIVMHRIYNYRVSYM